MPFRALLFGLFEAGFTVIDCQIHSVHIRALGARGIAREPYLSYLKQATALDTGNFWNQPVLSWPDPTNGSTHYQARCTYPARYLLLTLLGTIRLKKPVS